jgi:hypothetical protein
VLDAPVDIVLGEGARRDVVQPDIIFVQRARAQIVTEERLPAATPTTIRRADTTSSAGNVRAGNSVR